MKKKNIKSLALNKKSISSLSSLQRIVGGETGVYGPCNEYTVGCPPLTPSGQTECPSGYHACEYCDLSTCNDRKTCEIIAPEPPPPLG